MKSRPRAATVLVGLAVSAIFLWLAIRQIDGSTLVAALARANLWYIIASASTLCAGICFRAARWWVIAAQPPSAFRFVLRATNLGALSNLLFPARAGEFIRTVTLARLANVPLSRAAASAVIDRVLDVLVLALSAAVVCFLSPVEHLIGRWLFFAAFSLVTSTMLLVVLAIAKLDWQQLAMRVLGKFLSRWSIMPAAFLNDFRLELFAIVKSRKGLELLLAVILVWISDYLWLAGALAAFHLQLPFEAPLLLWVFLGAGAMLPSAPGYVGVYQIAVVWALSVYAVSPSVGVAIAVCLQATTLLVTSLMATTELSNAIKIDLRKPELRSDGSEM